MSQIPLLLIPLLFVQLGIGLPFFKKDKADNYEEDHSAWVYPPWEHTWGVVRARESHLNFFTLGKATFDNPQGLAVVRLTATDDPDKKGDDDEVTVYGINTGENAIIYNRSMRKIGLFGYKDEERDFLDTPWDVAALPNGLVFVTDSGNRRVVKFRNIDGDLIYEGDIGTEGEGALVLPRGIDVTDAGYLLVADAGADRVAIYDTSGVFLRAIGGMISPVGLAALDSSSEYTRPSRTYFAVTDSGGQRLRRVNFDGKVLAERDISRNEGVEGTYGGHVELDLYHNVVVTDSANNCLLKFNDKLELLSVWGQAGDGRTRFDGPTGIAIWRRFGQTFIAHEDGAHYLWVGVDINMPPRLQFPKPGHLKVGLSLTERAQIDLEILDEDGEILRERTIYKNSGDQNILWQYDKAYFVRPSKDEAPVVKQPVALAPGEYSLRIRLRATYSSRKAFEKVMETTINLTGM
jgi:NHL repeat